MDKLQIRKQYKYLKQNKTEIRVFSSGGKSIFVESEDEFVEYVTKLNSEENVYYGINERYNNGKTDLSVRYISNIFVDVDLKDSPDIEGFEKELKNKGFQYSFKIHTIGGFHYYIPVSKREIPEGDNETRDEINQLLLNFKKYFEKYKIDNKVFNLSRVTKVWGTKTWKYNGIVNIIDEKELSEDDIRKNTVSLHSLPAIVFDDVEYKQIKHDCNFMESYFNKKYPSGMEKNNYIHSNIVPYLKSKYDDKKARKIANKVMLLQGHNPSELNNWWIKSPEFNCGSIRNWCRKYDVEAEDNCWRCSKNDNKEMIRYINNAKSWNKIKKQMIDDQRTKKKRFAFYISKNKELRGHITITEYREIKQKLTIASIYKRKNEDEEDNRIVELDDMQTDEKVFHFIGDNKISKKIIGDSAPIYNHRVKLYVYDFETIDNERYTVLSENKIKLGENTIQGTEVYLNDSIEVGNKAKLQSQAPILFVYNTIPSVKEIQNNEELKSMVNKYELTEQKLYNSLFFLKREEGEEDVSYLHPHYFMRLVTVFLLASKREGYPLHLIIIGGKGTGKSYLRKVLTGLMKEREYITSTGGNTLKGIIPSHADRKKLELGSLIRANRIITWDEGLRILNKIKDDDSNEALGELNDIIVHDEFNSASGFHRQLGVKMKAKCIMMTNHVRVNDDIFKLYEKVSPSFLDRFLVFIQNKDHTNYVKSEKGKVKNYFQIPHNEWLSIYDYLVSKKVQFDKKRINELVDKYKNMIPDGELLDSFIGRYKSHHLICMLDGLVKLRSLCENEYDFIAKDIDYRRLDDLLVIVLNNWLGKKILNNVHDKIIEYIGKGISRHNILEWMKNENIDDAELKFLRDNNKVELKENNYTVVETQEIDLDDIEIDV